MKQGYDESRNSIHDPGVVRPGPVYLEGGTSSDVMLPDGTPGNVSLGESTIPIEQEKPDVVIEGSENAQGLYLGNTQMTMHSAMATQRFMAISYRSGKDHPGSQTLSQAIGTGILTRENVKKCMLMTSVFQTGN